MSRKGRKLIRVIAEDWRCTNDNPRSSNRIPGLHRPYAGTVGSLCDVWRVECAHILKLFNPMLDAPFLGRLGKLGLYKTLLVRYYQLMLGKGFIGLVIYYRLKIMNNATNALQKTNKMFKTKIIRKNALYPFPVVEVTLLGGNKRRYSFWVDKRKPKSLEETAYKVARAFWSEETIEGITIE